MNEMFYLMVKGNKRLAFNTPEQSDEMLREWGWQDAGTIQFKDIPTDATKERDEDGALSYSWSVA